MRSLSQPTLRRVRALLLVAAALGGLGSGTMVGAVLAGSAGRGGAAGVERGEPPPAAPRPRRPAPVPRPCRCPPEQRPALLA
jgi:hypothetical protein